MSNFDSQGTPWIPQEKKITGSGDTLNNLQKIAMGSGANRLEANIKDGLWLGGNTFATSKISMSFAGILTASDVILTGGSISGVSLTDLGVGSAPSIQGWTSDLVFSATDHDTVAWATGEIELTDGTTFTITAGNTGNISAVTFIYLDTDVSITVLQTTTTSSTPVGANKILIAVAEDVASGKKATFQAFGGQGGQNPLIVADNIAANTITANEILANTITGAEIVGTTLSAISANLGTITAGTVTGAIVQSATTGYRTKMSTAGFQTLNGNTVLGSINTGANGDIIITGTDDVILNAGGSDKAQFGGSGLKPLASGYDLGADVDANRFDVAYLNTVYLGGSWNISASSDQFIVKYGSIEKMRINGDKIRPAGTYESSDGTDGVSEAFEVATSFNESGGAYFWKARLLTFKDGILTNKGSESDWREIT